MLLFRRVLFRWRNCGTRKTNTNARRDKTININICLPGALNSLDAHACSLRNAYGTWNSIRVVHTYTNTYRARDRIQSIDIARITCSTGTYNIRAAAIDVRICGAATSVMRSLSLAQMTLNGISFQDRVHVPSCSCWWYRIALCLLVRLRRRRRRMAFCRSLGLLAVYLCLYNARHVVVVVVAVVTLSLLLVLLVLHVAPHRRASRSSAVYTCYDVTYACEHTTLHNIVRGASLASSSSCCRHGRGHAFVLYRAPHMCALLCVCVCVRMCK